LVDEVLYIEVRTGTNMLLQKNRLNHRLAEKLQSSEERGQRQKLVQ